MLSGISSLGVCAGEAKSLISLGTTTLVGKRLSLPKSTILDCKSTTSLENLLNKSCNDNKTY